MRLSGRAIEHLIVCVIYGTLCLLFFKEIVFQSQWFGEDFFTQHFPNRYFAAVELRKGSFPLWTPYVFGGMPFFADIQAGVLYPLNLALSFFVSDAGLSYAVYEYQVVLHLVLGGYFMYLFLRELNLDFASSLLGGALFAFNAFFISHAHHAAMVHAGIWLPLVFYFCRRGFRLAPQWFLGCPIVMAVSLFAGHPQITIYILYAFTAYFIFMAYVTKGGLLQSASRYGLAILLFFLLSAVQLLPTFEFLQNTARNVLSYGDAIKDSFPLKSLLTLFIEGMYGASYESWQRWEFSCYVGVGAVLLAVLGVMKRSDSEPVFFAFLAGLSLFLLLGENAPLYKLFYHVMPGFKFFRVPARFGYLFAFAISVLSACGFYSLTSRHSGGNKMILGLAVLLLSPGLVALALDLSVVKDYVVKYAIISAITLLAIFAIVRLGEKQRVVKYALILVILADLFLARNLHNQMSMSGEQLHSVIYQSPVAQVLKTSNEGARFFVGNKFSSYANLGLVYRRSNLSGYNQFQLKNYRKLNLSSPATLSFFGAEFVDYDSIALVAEQWKNLPDLETRFNFIVNPNARPHAFVVGRASLDNGFDLQKALDDGFDPLTVVYLDRELSSDEQAGSALPGYSITRYENKGNEIAVDLQSDEKGILVVSEVYYPGWRVYVNDGEKEVLRADTLLRAVPVGKGSNHVRFVFQPRSFVIGSVLSIVTLLGLIAYIGVFRYRS